jgi:hypothetical protein
VGNAAATFCINCGERLAPEHRFCWACGAARWEPPAAAIADGTGAPSPPQARGAAAATLPTTPVAGALLWIFAGGAVLWLVSLAQTAGVLAASPTRAQLLDQLGKAGYHGQTAITIAVVEGAGMLLVGLVIAALHGAAFYGLRARRRWGWVAAVLVAGAWSLVLVGIPMLAILLRSSTRRAYGVS